MADTIITVQGEYSAWYPAEQATVRAAVHVDGPKRDDVFSRAVGGSNAVRTLTEKIFDANAGPVTWWTSDSVRVWSERPWNNDGTQLAPIFHSALDFAVKFTDFDALARWVEATATIDGVTVDSVSWDLTETTRAAATNDVRSRAVKDAVTKATVYAQSIGLTSVRAIALADPGMLGDPAGGATAPSPVFARAAMRAQAFEGGGGTPQLALRPEEIAVASVVDARFTAS